jgi:molybdopterin-guanine dinucleotide biosynthesis protein A
VSLSTAGYVLVGGRSSRFGADKALLDWHGRPLALHVAREVQEAAGVVTLVGAPERYAHLGLAVILDPVSGHGPLAGLQAALEHTSADWNLVVACDMPNLTAPFLRSLLETAAGRDPDLLLPRDAAGRAEPLCAVYHRRCLPAIQAAIRQDIHKMTDAFASLRVLWWPVADPRIFANLNTPADRARI